MMNGSSYQMWLQQATKLLQSQLTENPYLDPKRDALVLLQTAIGQPSAYILAFGERLLEPETERQLNHWLERRLQGEPIAYIVGQKEFWSLPLAVTSATLIPRPDTEILVEQAITFARQGLKTIAQITPKQTRYRILDLGTGTGAIILALASELLVLADQLHINLELVAVDRQPEAVALAQHNAKKLGLERVQFGVSDWFSALPKQAPFDLIVSNPPYIDVADPNLSVGDVRFEPVSALVAEQEGYADLQKIIQFAPEYLKPQGWLILEHGWQQAKGVQQLFQQANLGLVEQQLVWQQIQSKVDYADKPRISFAKLYHQQVK